MASSSIKTLSLGGNTYSLEDTQARESLSTKVDKVAGRGLSENNFTTAEKDKLAGISPGATANTGTVTGVKINGTTKNPSGGIVDLGTVITAHQPLDGKQDLLVSGSNIKTINGQSLLGSGNIQVEGGGGSSSAGITVEEATTFYCENRTLSGTQGYTFSPSGNAGRSYYYGTVINGTESLLLSFNPAYPTELYLLIDNTENSNDVAVAIGGASLANNPINSIITPDGGIEIQAGAIQEISCFVFDGDDQICIITCSGNLKSERR